MFAGDQITVLVNPQYGGLLFRIMDIYKESTVLDGEPQ